MVTRLSKLSQSNWVGEQKYHSHTACFMAKKHLHFHQSLLGDLEFYIPSNER